MSDAIFMKAMDNGWYFVLLIWMWYILYMLWKIFISEHMKYEEQRTTSFVELTNKTIENTTKIVDSLNTHRETNTNAHNTIISKLDETHNDVKIIKEKMK